jgi:hypothetical protein
VPRNRKKGVRVGLRNGLLAICVIAGIGTVAVISQPAARDETSLCLKPQPGTSDVAAEGAHHLLVIDKTDKWNGAQEARLRKLITAMRDQLGINERLSIFVFSTTPEPGFPPRFSLCNPGRASDTNFWISNPRKWEKRYLESFGKPLDDILADLTSASEGPLSPILEILVDLTNREEFHSHRIHKRIVMVSDMLQNSDAYTFFPKRILIPQPLPRPAPGAPVGGPFEPMPLTPPGATRNDASKGGTPAPKYRTPEPRKLSPRDAENMVERKGGLQYLREFRIEVYQIRGKYPEEKLTAARQFWELIAGQYGAKIEWKVL